MGIIVKLQVFEGPLDLLLHLLEKNKVDIYDIPIVEITKQYMEYIVEIKKMDLNIMSEFLVMAATLIDIKSRMLLPAQVNEEGLEDDPRQELVEKLLEYKMFKYISYELKDRQVDAQKVQYKGSTIPKEVASYVAPIDINALLAGITLSKMQVIFEAVMKRQEDKVDPIRSKFGRIEKEEISLSEKMEELEQYVLEHKTFRFRQILEKQKSKMQIIVTFLAILEMMKVGIIQMMEAEATDDCLFITVQK